MSADRLTRPKAMTARPGAQPLGPAPGPRLVSPEDVCVTRPILTPGWRVSSSFHTGLRTVAAMDTALAVEVDGVTKKYGDLVAVDDVSLRVAQGEVYGVLGPNGAGKTTLLRMLFGLLRPNAGTIRVFGQTWAEAGVGVLDGVGGFIESPRFYPYLT